MTVAVSFSRMTRKDPERHEAFGRVDPRMRKLLAPSKTETPKTAPVDLPTTPDVGSPRNRIIDRGCHDFGELYED